MIIDLNEINEIDMIYDFSGFDFSNTDLIDIKDFSLKGETDEFNNIELDIKGTMILPCSLSLVETEYPFNTKIEGNIIQLLEEIDQNLIKNSNSIDIFPIIWENILMEIPMKVVSSESNITKGEGWKLITDEANNKLEDLNEILKSEV